MNTQVLELRFNDTEDFSFNEAIKTLRTNLQFSGSRVKKILITSVAPNDGKSIITMMLGKAFAESGKKTVVIDADTGLRSLDVLLGMENDVVYDLTDRSGRIWPRRNSSASWDFTVSEK